MENSDLLRRAEDLQSRCEKNGVLTATHFLTPAERFRLERWAKTQPGCRLVFSGGHPDCERTVGFFLPDWLEADWLPLDEQIRAFELTAPFGSPGHRDYLGALLGMGIGRERIGDIWVKDGSAVVFCLPGVEKHLLSIDKVGHDSVRARPLELAEVTPPERKVKRKSFSVQSLRLDAVTGGLFDLSRSEAARQVEAGTVSLNYEVCMKSDAPVREGDILSLRGKGKGRITGFGGTSRKGRQFVEGEIYLS
ncbi:MAG: RNA-binding protein [Oscillospiraceae bacterium]|nr:RNA-binding protein [Oscillospiraceae bacterium]